MATVSIILPVYNVSKYIDKCLNSLVSQTFSDIEIILINDGSTDTSGEKCLEWASSDIRIIYVSKKNEGAGPSRNLGINMASTELVAFCDPDDWYSEQFIELMLERQNETDADVVVCGYHRYHERLRKIVSTYIPEYTDSHSKLQRWSLTHSLCCKLIRRGLFIDNSITMPTGLAQDTAIHFFLMTKAEKVVTLERGLYYYMFNRPGSAMNSNITHTSCTVSYLTYNWDLFIKNGIFNEYKESLFINTLGIINYWYSRILNENEYARKWLSDCLQIMRIYFGDVTDKLFGLRTCTLGSYSLHNSVVIKGFDMIDECEYCFTGLISYMSDIEAAPPAVGNSFRQIALERDFDKSFKKSVAKGQFDFIVIDFLDERFDIAMSRGGYFTISNAFMDADIPFEYVRLNRLDKDTVKLWEEKCVELIALLKEKYFPNRVVLVRNYLTEKFGSYHCQKVFNCIDEIRRLNSMIKKCYEFFEANFPGIHVIEVNDSKLCYTSEHFRHGREPWHYSNGYYYWIRDKIFEYVSDIMDARLA